MALHGQGWQQRQVGDGCGEAVIVFEGPVSLLQTGADTDEGRTDVGEAEDVDNEKIYREHGEQHSHDLPSSKWSYILLQK